MDNTIMAMSTNVLDAIIQLRRAVARAAALTFSGDISGRQAAILREIGACGPVTQVGLARATASDPSALVRILDDFEKREFVERRRSESDRREMLVSLTAKGRKVLGPLDMAHKRLADATAAALTGEERRVFVVLAEKIRSSLAARVESVSSARTFDGQR
jgi:DNA-binding MarR family transcriptional regulator